MDYTTLPARLARIKNLKEFADRAGLQRRTLQRIKTATSSPSLNTCAKIEQKLKEIRPAMWPAEREAA